MLIYIEGNIGSGKSTFVNKLKAYIDQLDYVGQDDSESGENLRQKFNTVLVQEPVDEWMVTYDSDGKNILEKFYEDQYRWGFTFQMNSFISRAHRIQEERMNKNNTITSESNIDFVTDENSDSDNSKDANPFYVPPEVDKDNFNYNAYTKKFDETIYAQDLCDQDELMRLRSNLEKQIDNMDNIISNIDPRILCVRQR